MYLLLSSTTLINSRKKYQNICSIYEHNAHIYPVFREILLFFTQKSDLVEILQIPRNSLFF